MSGEAWVCYPRGKKPPMRHVILGQHVIIADEAEQYWTALETEVSELRAMVGRLKLAIDSHRRNIWGDGKVSHPEDVRLYRALEMEAHDG